MRARAGCGAKKAAEPGRSARLVLVLVLVLEPLLVTSGCSQPEPPTPAERARANDAALREAQARERARDEAEARRRATDLGAQGGGGGGLGLDAPPRETPAQAKRRLLDAYGERLTPFQRSALLAARIETYAEGEAMCKKWIDENGRFDQGKTGEDR